MTRMHFEAIAKACLDAKPHARGIKHPEYVGWAYTVRMLADMCGRSNDRFDRERFCDAAGWVEEKDTP